MLYLYMDEMDEIAFSEINRMRKLLRNSHFHPMPHPIPNIHHEAPRLPQLGIGDYQAQSTIAITNVSRKYRNHLIGRKEREKRVGENRKKKHRLKIGLKKVTCMSLYRNRRYK
ncbi:hypothetical protein HN011_000060 [Eciton burchellii]|nr:hypothetical protein HN011_000060 [Eciton burchellii]